jgi:uncharacterized protein (DUF2147 family)
MKGLLAVVAFLLASSAAQAQYTFDYGGRTIRIDPDRGTVSIPGVYDNTGRRKRAHSGRDSDRPRKQTPEQAKVEPLAPVQPDPAPATIAAPPADTSAPVQQDAAPISTQPPAPAVATAPPPPAPVQQQATAAPASTAQPSNSPLGLWLTEEKEGKVRIEQCGANLCGYSVDKKSNQNGEQVLINMKAGTDAKWSGRIFDPNTGSTYESTIAMKGTDSLRVQGCAFGGMFCGGQTWSRVN